MPAWEIPAEWTDAAGFLITVHTKFTGHVVTLILTCFTCLQLFQA